MSKYLKKIGLEVVYYLGHHNKIYYRLCGLNGRHLFTHSSRGWSGPITSWEIDGETVETVSDFISGGSKITADGDCSHEIKRHLLLGRKVMTNLDSILKSRDITLPAKVRLVKAVVFPVVTYGCESWTVKKAEHRRTDEDSWESLGLQGDPTSPSWRRSTLEFLWREWC